MTIYKNYMFPLVGAAPGGSYFYFRPPETADYPYIAHWMAKSTGLPAPQQKKLEAVLLQQLLATEHCCRPYSLIAIAGGSPVFFLELAGDEVYLTCETERLQLPAPKNKWPALADHLHALA